MMQRSSRISEQESPSVSERELPPKLGEQFKESAQFEKVIRENLQALGYEK